MPFKSRPNGHRQPDHHKEAKKAPTAEALRAAAAEAAAQTELLTPSVLDTVGYTGRPSRAMASITLPEAEPATRTPRARRVSKPAPKREPSPRDEGYLALIERQKSEIRGRDDDRTQDYSFMR